MRRLPFEICSGSSSEGVGRTLEGAFVEPFLGVFAVVFAGVATVPAVDRLFLGEDLVSSLKHKKVSKLLKYATFALPPASIFAVALLHIHLSRLLIYPYYSAGHDSSSAASLSP